MQCVLQQLTIALQFPVGRQWGVLWVGREKAEIISKWGERAGGGSRDRADGSWWQRLYELVPPLFVPCTYPSQKAGGGRRRPIDHQVTHTDVSRKYFYLPLTGLLISVFFKKKNQVYSREPDKIGLWAIF